MFGSQSCFDTKMITKQFPLFKNIETNLNRNMIFKCMFCFVLSVKGHYYLINFATLSIIQLNQFFKEKETLLVSPPGMKPTPNLKCNVSIN